MTNFQKDEAKFVSDLGDTQSKNIRDIWILTKSHADTRFSFQEKKNY